MFALCLLSAIVQIGNALTSPTPDATPSLAVTVPSTPPSSAVSVSPNLVSLSIEGDRWPDWAAIAPAYTARNNFVYNVLTNLQAKVGSPTSFRIGADSEDHTMINPAVPVEVASFPGRSATMPYPEAKSLNVSQAYYALSRFLPSGTKVTWGINFGAENVTLAIQETSIILKAFNSDENVNGVILDVLELGNEADAYGGSKHRNYSDWGMQPYVTQWTQYAQAIIEATGMKQGQRPGFQGLSFTRSDHSSVYGGYSPQQAVKDGLLSSTAGKYIDNISQHQYSGGCCSARIEDLMNKSYIRSNLTQWKPDIAFVNAQGLPYILGETNSYYNHGVPKISDAGGAAIWIVDHSLFGASLGIAQMFFHEGEGYKYNLIQPVALNYSSEDATPLNPPQPAHVQTTYYGAIVINEFLGTTTGREIVELNIASSTSISGYALYTGGTLRRALFINHDAYHSGTRSSVNISLGGSGSVQVKRLAVPTSDVLTGLKWGGQSYDTSSGLASGTVVTTTLARTSPLVVSATEVVMVTF